jgi:hypothetical protein
MRSLRPYLLLIALLGPLLAYAQVTLEASVNQNPVRIGERFKYTVTLDGVKGNIIAPDFKNFRIVGGPQSSSNMSWVNGTMSVTSAQTYFLTPLKKGSLTIAPAKANTRDGELKSNSIVLEVVEGDAGAQNQQTNQNKATQEQSSASKEELFIRIYTDKKQVSKGEQIVVSYVLFNRYRGFEMEHYEMPKLTGFWKEDVKINNVTWEKKNETIGNKIYQKAYLARQVLFPQRDGELEIGPFNLDARVGRSFFNQGQQVKLRSNTVKIDVSPLPSSPSAYNGAVGSFDMKVNLDRTEVATNEAINMTVKISGSGNLKLINELPIEFPNDFEVYDPKITDRISTNAGGVKGSRTFEYLIIPRYPGTYDLDPIEFSYYDPAQKKYRSRSSKALSIEVQRSGNEAEDGSSAPMRKEDVAVLDSDIRHIETGAGRWKEKDSHFAGSVGHMAGVGLPLFLIIGLFFFKRRQSEMDADVVGTKKRKAGKMANKHLVAAKKLMDAGDKDAFYEELYTGINGYLGDKFNILSSDMGADSIKRTMTEQQVDAQLISRVEQLRTNCEMARFAPNSSLSDAQLYAEAESLINALEENT